jgi:hypothetical protein
VTLQLWDCWIVNGRFFGRCLACTDPIKVRALLSQRSVRFYCLRTTGSCRRTGIPRLESVDSPGNVPVQAIVSVLIDHTIAVDIRSRFDARLVTLRVYLGIAQECIESARYDPG